jgi:hypothetical protein
MPGAVSGVVEVRRQYSSVMQSRASQYVLYCTPRAVFVLPPNSLSGPLSKSDGASLSNWGRCAGAFAMYLTVRIGSLGTQSSKLRTKSGIAVLKHIVLRYRKSC